MSLFEHVPHPHVEARKRQGPVKVGRDRMRLNDRVAARATIVFGTMWMTYALVVYGALGAVFTREQATLLYWSNWVQLWSLPLLMVGAVVLGRGAERRNQQAFDDTEAILHGQEQAAAHMAAQDAVIAAIAGRLGLDAAALCDNAMAPATAAPAADTPSTPGGAV